MLKTAAADAANDLYLIWRTIAQSPELVPPVIYLAVLELGNILYNIFFAWKCHSKRGLIAFTMDGDENPLEKPFAFIF